MVLAHTREAPVPDVATRAMQAERFGVVHRTGVH